MPPAVEVMGDRARADRAEAVEFGNGFDFDRYGHGLFLVLGAWLNRRLKKQVLSA